MTSYVPAALRRLVNSRAEGLCEYCSIHEEDTFFGCQIEHVIAEKHGGGTTAENLAYACVFCNQRKGSDISSLSSAGQLVRLYNPRTDRWADHFALAADGITVQARSEIGEVTARLLGFNDPARLAEREALHAVNRFPTTAAASRIASRG